MALNSLLEQRIGKGAFVDRTPVIIEMVEGMFGASNEIFRLPSIEPRHSIRRFNQISATIPNRTIDALNDRTDIVKDIFLDDDVPFPAPPAPGSSRLFTLSDALSLGGLSIPGAGALKTITGLSNRSILNRTRARVTRQRTPSQPEPGWIPTSMSRQLVGADVARAEGIEGRNVRTAVMDTGVPTPFFLPGHPTLGGRVEQFHLGPFPRPDRVGHGTHVASTIGGKKFTAPNGLVTEGIAPLSVLGSFKVLQTRLGIGTNSDILKGLEMAMTWNAQLFNMSLGSNTFVPDSPFEKPFQQIIATGGIPIAAAGNSGPDPSTVGTPGGSLHCISVGSVNQSNQPAGFSSRGPAGTRTKPDVASFGGDNKTDEFIYTGTSGASTIDGLDDNNFDELGPAHGTSMACPTFAGTAALWDEWLQVNRSRRLTFADVQTILQKNGLSKNNNVGWGVAQYDWVKVL
jgi:subtilisin family serine protease